MYATFNFQFVLICSSFSSCQMLICSSDYFLLIIVVICNYNREKKQNKTKTKRGLSECWQRRGKGKNLGL